jgi:hypothetical protein
VGYRILKLIQSEGNWPSSPVIDHKGATDEDIDRDFRSLLSLNYWRRRLERDSTQTKATRDASHVSGSSDKNKATRDASQESGTEEEFSGSDEEIANVGKNDDTESSDSDENDTDSSSESTGEDTADEEKEKSPENSKRCPTPESDSETVENSNKVSQSKIDDSRKRSASDKKQSSASTSKARASKDLSAKKSTKSSDQQPSKESSVSKKYKLSLGDDDDEEPGNLQSSGLSQRKEEALKRAALKSKKLSDYKIPKVESKSDDVKTILSSLEEDIGPVSEWFYAEETISSVSTEDSS